MSSFLRCTAAVCALPLLAVGPAIAEIIQPEVNSLPVEPGETARALYLLTENQTPLFGYSLELEVVPCPGATGSVTIDASATNFFDARNLITAAGQMRDPAFSTISERPFGAFVSTNVLGDQLVLAVPGVNDALAEVAFRASADATGKFEVRLRTGTALSDGQGFAVPFESMILSINVVPTPMSTLLLLAGILPIRRRSTC